MIRKSKDATIFVGAHSTHKWVTNTFQVIIVFPRKPKQNGWTMPNFDRNHLFNLTKNRIHSKFIANSWCEFQYLYSMEPIVILFSHRMNIFTLVARPFISVVHKKFKAYQSNWSKTFRVKDLNDGHGKASHSLRI